MGERGNRTVNSYPPSGRQVASNSRPRAEMNYREIGASQTQNGIRERLAVKRAGRAEHFECVLRIAGKLQRH